MNNETKKLKSPRVRMCVGEVKRGMKNEADADC